MLWFKIAVLTLLAAWLYAQLRAVGSYVATLRSSDCDEEARALSRRLVVRQMWIGLALVISSGIAAVIVGVPLR